MKKNVRNALAISGLALAIGASGLTLTASANNDSARHQQRAQQDRIIRSRKAEHVTKSVIGRRTIAGTVTTVSLNSLTLKSGSKVYTINTDSTTRILNRQWKIMKLTDIKSGEKVRVFGKLTDNTVTAKTLRDISVPSK